MRLLNVLPKFLFFGAVGVAFGLPMLGWWTPCYAAILTQQPTSTVAETGLYVHQGLGNGLLGKTAGVFLYWSFNRNGASDTGFQWRINAYSDAGYSNLISGTSTALLHFADTGDNPNKEQVYFPITPFNFDPALYYMLFLYSSPGGLTNEKVHGQTDGNYWCLTGCSTVSDIYYIVTDSGGLPPEQEATYTHFFNVWPPTGTVATTSQVNFQADYYVEPLEMYDRVGFRITEKSRTYETMSDTIPLSGTGFGHIEMAFNLTGTTSYAFWGYLRATPTSSGEFLDYVTHEIDIFKNPFPDILGAPLDDLNSLATSTCSLMNITGCFQNALVWAFWPDPDAWTNLENVGDLVIKKPPLGYVALLKNALNSLEVASTSAFTLVQSAPVMTSIVNPLRTGLSWAVWLFFAGWLLGRLKNFNV